MDDDDFAPFPGKRPSVSAPVSAPASHRPEIEATDSPRTEASSSNIYHKVTKRDTLAGLAIRYNVTVADIKRANGLLSDNALYARDTIIVPTGGLQPLGEDVQRLVAQIAAGLYRDPVLNPEISLHPASAAAERVARVLQAGDGPPYFPGDPSIPWWCQCGTCDEDENRTACRDRRQRSTSSDGGREVEMQDRNAAGPFGVLMAPDQAGGPTRMAEHMRRRRHHSETNLTEAEQRLLSPRHGGGGMQTFGFASHNTGQQGEGVATVMRQLADFGRNLGAKIKAAANQSALAAPQLNNQSFAAAADAVLGSIRGNWKPLGSQSSPGLAGGMDAPPLPQSRPGSQLPVPPKKRAGGKTD